MFNSETVSAEKQRADQITQFREYYSYSARWQRLQGYLFSGFLQSVEGYSDFEKECKNNGYNFIKLWDFLFSDYCQNKFKKIWEILFSAERLQEMQAGNMLPTAAEMGEKTNKKSTVNLFQPSNESLWVSLLSHEKGRDLLPLFIELEICPAEEDLAQLWKFLLFPYTQGHDVIKTLFRMDTASLKYLWIALAKLSARSSEFSEWRFNSPEGYANYVYYFLKKLIELEVYPRAEDLSWHDKDETHAWYWFIRAGKPEILEELFKLGLYPTSEMLSHFPKLTDQPTDEHQLPFRNTNTWAWFFYHFAKYRHLSSANSERYHWYYSPTWEKLFLRFVKEDAWYWWALNATYYPVDHFLEKLARENIQPTAEDLSRIYRKHNVNAWYWLLHSAMHAMHNAKETALFTIVLPLDLYPNNDDLSVAFKTEDSNLYSKSDGKIFKACEFNGWLLLAMITKRTFCGRQLFNKLLEQGKYPNDDDLRNGLTLDTTLADIGLLPWDHLITGAREDELQKIIEKLFAASLYPPNLALNLWSQAVCRGASMSDNSLKLLSEVKLNHPQTQARFSVMAAKIIGQGKRLKELHKKYQLTHDTNISLLLMRDDLKDFHGFLIVVLGIINQQIWRQKPQDFEKQLRKINVLWIMAKYIFPGLLGASDSIQKQILDYIFPLDVQHRIFSVSHQFSFVAFKLLNEDNDLLMRDYFVNLLDAYIKQCQGSFKHKERAVSLQKALCAGNETPARLLTNQWLMKTHPGKTPYKNVPLDKHQTPYSKIKAFVSSDEQFQDILRDGAVTCRRDSVARTPGLI